MGLEFCCEHLCAHAVQDIFPRELTDVYNPVDLWLCHNARLRELALEAELLLLSLLYTSRSIL